MIRAMLAICRKDLSLWRRKPWLIFGALAVPLSYTGLVFLGSQATSHQPVAVVNLDRGTGGAQIVRAILDSDLFRVTVTTPARARELYRALRVAAVITIPPGFTGDVSAHQRAPVNVTINNLDLDFTNDVRRAGPDALITWYQQHGPASPVKIHVATQMMLRQDVQLYQYSVLPVLVFVITVNGIIAAGMAAAGEFEARTVKELLMAPIPRAAIIGGKVLAGFTSTTVLGSAMLTLGAILGFTRPQDARYWAAAFVIIGLAAAFASGAGIAVGTWFRRRAPVSIAATILAVDLFGIAGGLGVISFAPPWLQRLAVYDPLTYAIEPLQHAVFYSSAVGFTHDAAVLALASAAVITAGTLAMRRQLVAK